MAEIPTNGEVNFNIVFSGSDGTAPANDNEGAGTPAAPTNNGKPSSKDSTSSNSNSIALPAGVHAALSLGQRAVSTAVSNIGKATGDYDIQRSLQQGMEIAGTTVGLVASFSNPVTAVAAIGALAISTGARIWQEYNENKWANRKAANLAKLYGFASDEGR